MQKKTVALVLIILCVLQSGALAVSPELEEQGQTTISLLRYNYLEQAIPSLSVSGTTATYSLSVRGKSEVTSISVSMQLQRGVNKEWVNYGQAWTASSTGNTLRTSGTKTVPTGYTWRLMATITLYYSGGSSTEVVYS